MTIEEIKDDIDRQIDRCNIYGYGLIAKVLERIRRLLDDLEPSWNVYPDEKPKEMGRYLTTTPNGKVREDWYNETIFEERDEEPIAWMDMPKPYKRRTHE